MVVAPIIVRQIGGTVYPVYGYFSPEARETAGEKIKVYPLSRTL